MIEFVQPPEEGRCYREEFLVRLGDADMTGLLRLDGVARFLQDVATDDWIDTGVISSDTWVVRRTTLRLRDGGHWPRYLERVTAVTWCGGVGAAWAERRTDLAVDGVTAIETVALWVPVDGTGRPVRLRQSFFDVYGESARKRKVSGRINVAAIPEGASRRAWPLRVADLDIVGHVNNAAVWQAVSEVAPAPLRCVSVTHHASIEVGDEVALFVAPGALWLLVGGEVRVSAQYSPA